MVFGKIVRSFMKRSFCLFLRGIGMGAADLVPGVSGGTIAFITGIYDELLSSLKAFDVKALSSLYKLQFKDFFDRVNGKFIIPLILGILFSLLSFSQLIAHMLNDATLRTYLYASFNGLILSSIIFCWRKLKDKNITNIIILIISLIVATYITSIEKVSKGRKRYNCKVELNLAADNYSNGILYNLSAEQLEVMLIKNVITKDAEVYSVIEGVWAPAGDFIVAGKVVFFNFRLAVCGLLAALAMLLPGISGSYILHILGSYTLIISALSGLLSSASTGIINWMAFRDLFSLCVGVILGLIFFSRMISCLLQYYQQQTISVLVGFMVGAIRAVWPFWSSSFIVDPLYIEQGLRINLIDPILPSFDLNLLMVGMVFILTFLLIFFAEKTFSSKVTLNAGR